MPEVSEAQLSFAMLSASNSFTLKYTQNKPSSSGFLQVLSRVKRQKKKKKVWKKGKAADRETGGKIKQGSTHMDLQGG